MKKNDSSLVFVVNSNYYLDLLKIALYSLSVNNDVSTLDINLFCPPGDESLFYPILEKFKFKAIFIHEINVKKYADITFTDQRDWKLSPAYRFEIFKLNKYKNILYLDTDILVTSNLMDIFHTDKFSACSLNKITNKYYFDDKFEGFNAGVMLIPNEFLRAKYANTLLKLCKKKKFNGNQEPLNLCFKDHINFLPQSYNLTTDLLTLENIDIAKIIHFIGLEKYSFTENKLYFSSYVNNFLSDFLKAKLNNLYNKYFLEAKQFYGE